MHVKFEIWRRDGVRFSYMGSLLTVPLWQSHSQGYISRKKRHLRRNRTIPKPKD